MSAHAYTEDQLVEQPAIGLFAELGWQTVSAWEEIFGHDEPPSLRATLSKWERANPAATHRLDTGWGFSLRQRSPEGPPTFSGPANASCR